MTTENPIALARKILCPPNGYGGYTKLAEICDVTYQAVCKWEKNGMPRTEWSKETSHCEKIAKATKGKVTRKMLLSWGRQ